MRHPATLNLVALLCLSIAMTVSVRASQETAPATTPLLPANTSGEEIYRQACAACHNVDGSGEPQTVVGFQLPLPNGHSFPDFNDCATYRSMSSTSSIRVASATARLAVRP
jgi:cytochrome c